MKPFAAAFILVLFAASAARAGSITVTADFSEVTPKMFGKIWGEPHFSTGVATHAGVFNFKVDAADPGSGFFAGDRFKAFDLELQLINPKSNVYTVEVLEAAPVGASPGPEPGDTMGALRAALLRNLWYQVSQSIGMSPLDTTNRVQATAFQLAVWAVVYDPVLPDLLLDASTPHAAGNPGFWATGFSTTAEGSAIVLANSWLGNLDPDGPQTPGLLALVDPDRQDFMFMAPGLPPAGIAPLPGAVWMGLALLSGLAVVRARRRR